MAGLFSRKVEDRHEFNRAQTQGNAFFFAGIDCSRYVLKRVDEHFQGSRNPASEGKGKAQNKGQVRESQAQVASPVA